MRFNIPKLNFKTTAIIAGIVLFGLIVPNLSHTANIFGLDGASIAQSVLAWVGQLILNFFSIFVDLAASFLESMLNIGFASHKGVVELGWKIVRDFSNMFFVLFMVVIAFATILRIERYGIKELLPKVIIIALLINFSLVICYLVIDFSDIAAHFFINSAKQGFSGEQSIAGVLKDGLKIKEIMAPVDCDSKAANDAATCNMITDETERNTCVNNARIAYSNCMMGIQKQRTDVEGFINIITSMIFGSIILLLSTFVLFAGGILILIRLFFLWFLVMMVPLVFLCYLMPALRGNWQKWWRSFLNWCFFAPIYCFFIWLAVKLIQAKEIDKIIGVSENASINQTLGTSFFGTIDNLIVFLFTIALLLGGLIAAKQLGIYGAAAAMSIVQKAGKGAKDWAKRTTTRPLAAAGTKARAGAFALGGALFGDTKLGRRMKARAAQIKRAPEERPEHKKYDAMLNTMSKEDLLREVETAGGVRKFIAARKAQGKGWLRDAKTSQVQAATDAMKAFGATEVAKQIEETRLDSIRDTREQETTVQKVVQEGNLNKIPAIALKDERLVAAITRLASAKQIESLRDVSPQHADNLKTTLDQLTTVGNATMNILSPSERTKVHHAYASQTGDIDRMSTPDLEAWAKKAGPEGIKRLQITCDPLNIGIVAEQIPTNQLANAVEKLLNGEVARLMANHLKSTVFAPTNTQALANQKAVNENPYLKTLTT